MGVISSATASPRFRTTGNDVIPRKRWNRISTPRLEASSRSPGAKKRLSGLY